MKITIIGLGTVGEAVLKEISKKQEAIGIDLDESKITKLKNQGYKVNTTPETSDVYIICVYSTEEVLNTIKKLDYSNKPLICIESTIIPSAVKDLVNTIVKQNKSNLVICPHRLNQGDKEHQVFNLKRVFAGATPECTKRGLSFYQEFMPEENLTQTSLEYAVLSKLLENAYRFTEIAIAEEIKMLCDKEGLDFDELRKCVNTKWNIDIKEARTGIYGRCLPKDIKLLNKYFEDNIFFNEAIKLDKKFKNKEQKR